MLYEKVYQVVHEKKVSELRLAYLLRRCDDDVLSHLYARPYLLEPLERERDAVVFAIHSPLPPVLEITHYLIEITHLRPSAAC